MPISGSLFKNQEISIGLLENHGLPSLVEKTVGGNFGMKAAARFLVGTGTPDYPDLAYTATTQTLLPDYRVPKGMRCYVTKIELGMPTVTGGAAAWAGGTGITLQDSQGNIFAGFPLGSLGVNCAYRFPESQTWYPFITTCTGSSSTTTLANVSDTYIASATASLVGTYVRCVSGTAANLGLVRQISAHTTSSFTVSSAWPAAPASGDTFEMYGIQGKATMGATTITPNNITGLATAHLLDTFGSVTLISGTGVAGQSRQITSQTNAPVFTTGTFSTAPDTSTIFCVNDAPQLFGAFDFYSTQNHAPLLAQGYGLQAVVGGTMTQGSPLRILIEGFFAA